MLRICVTVAVLMMSTILPAESYNLVTVDTKAGPIKVENRYAPRFVGFINALKNAGNEIKSIGCYSYRYINRRYTHGRRVLSEHAKGRACDINQRARNITSTFMRKVTELAHEWGLRDGCEWRSRDCGHVEVITAVKLAVDNTTELSAKEKEIARDDSIDVGEVKESSEKNLSSTRAHKHRGHKYASHYKHRGHKYVSHRHKRNTHYAMATNGWGTGYTYTYSVTKHHHRR